MNTSRVQERIEVLSTAAILAAIVGIAFADSLVVDDLSLGFLYLLPLVFSGLIHPLWFSSLLALTCVILRESFGPFIHFEARWVARDLILTGAYFSLIVLAHRLAQQRRSLYAAIERQHDIFQREIELAAKVQQRLFVQGIPHLPHMEISVRLKPANIVSGDYYDFIQGPDGTLIIVVADVSGKGVPAALLMSAIQTALRLIVENTSNSADVTAKLNQILCELTETENYVSLFYGKLNLESGVLEYTNAGHHPPILIKADSELTVQLSTGGPVVGMLPQARFESAIVPIQPHDLLILYTDGLVEAENNAGEHYGLERLMDLVCANRMQNVDSLTLDIRQSVFDFVSSAELTDDMTVIAIRRLPPQGSSEGIQR